MSKKIKVIVPIVLGLIILLGIAWGVYAFVTNTPKNAYLLSEKKTAKNVKSYVDHRFSNEKKFQKKLKDNSYVNTYDLHANASKEYLKDLGLPKTILDSSKITGTIGHDPKSNKGIMSVSPKILDKDIGKFQWTANDSTQFFDSPLFKKKYSVKNSELLETAAQIFDEDPSDYKEERLSNANFDLNNKLGIVHSQQEDVEKLIKRYTDLVIDQLEDDDFEKGKKEKVKIDGETKNLKPITLNISRDKAKKITVAALKKAKNDKELQRLSSINEKEYKKEIEEQLEDAQDKQTKEFPKIKSTIYQQKHQILKRNITITDSDGEKTTIKGTNVIDDNIEVDYKVTSDGNTHNIKGSSKKDGKHYKDDYKYSGDVDYERLNVHLNNKESVKDSKRKDTGTITIDNAIDHYKVNYEDNLETDAKNNLQKQTLNIGFKLDEEPINIVINANSKLKERIDFNTDNATDFNSLSKKDKDKLSDEIKDKQKDIVKSVFKKLDN